MKTHPTPAADAALKLCINCQHHRLPGGRHHMCAHPEAPVDLVTGSPALLCDTARVKGACGTAATWFEPSAVTLTEAVGQPVNAGNHGDCAVVERAGQDHLAQQIGVGGSVALPQFCVDGSASVGDVLPDSVEGAQRDLGIGEGHENSSSGLSLCLPLPGTHWPEHGGIFAGLLVHDNQLCALIVATEDLGEHALGTYGKDVKTSYADGLANTRALGEAGSEISKQVLALTHGGMTDWYIPSQAEAHLMAATLMGQLPKDWYWTSSQTSRDYGWLQSFDYGTQINYFKDDALLVRPVRRSILQSFGPSQVSE